MNELKSPCQGYEAKLTTVSALIDKVKVEQKKGPVSKRNLVWLELTGCSGGAVA